MDDHIDRTRKGTIRRQVRTVVILGLLFAVGIGAFAHLLIREDRKKRADALYDRGRRLVNLIALYPIRDVSERERTRFLRVFHEHNRLAYLFVHDGDGGVIASVAPGPIATEVPVSVSHPAVFTTTDLTQTFHGAASGVTIYEFAKPTFVDGVRSGSVRVGFALPPPVGPSNALISQLAMFVFFMMATVIVGYYLISLAVKRLQNVGPNVVGAAGDDESAAPGASRDGGIVSIVEHLDDSVSELKTKLRDTSADRTKLESKLGVVAFEKKQVFRMLDAMDFGIIIIDLDDQASYINVYALKLFGRDRDESAAPPLREVVNNDDLMRFCAEQRVQLRGEPSHVDIEFSDVAAGRIFRASVAFIRTEGGDYAGRVITLTDVTRDRLAMKAQEDFIARLSHELLTPLTSLQGYSEMLLDGEVSDAETTKEFYNTINLETRRLTALVKSLLNISKMEIGTLTIDKNIVRTDWFLKDCLPAVEGSAAAKNITIEKELPDKLPSMLGDKDLLKVAIINILGNAVKYTPEDGTIRFSMYEEDHHVVFDISDTGYGISATDLPHIFEKFYRGGDDEIRAEMGSGLGLSTAAEVVRLHDGTINVESEVGKGTRFVIRLPIEAYDLAS